MFDITSKNLPMIIMTMAVIVLFCVVTNAYLFNNLQQKDEAISLMQKRIVSLEKTLETCNTEITLLIQKGSNPTRTETVYDISFNSHDDDGSGFKEISGETEIQSAINRWDGNESITAQIDPENYKKFRDPESSKRIRESETQPIDSLEPPPLKKGRRKKKSK